MVEQSQTDTMISKSVLLITCSHKAGYWFPACTLPKCLTALLSVLERTTVRLSDADVTKWPSTSPSCQTWSRPAAPSPANLISWPSCVWRSPIWNPWGAPATRPLMEPTSPPSSLNRYCAVRDPELVHRGHSYKKHTHHPFTLFLPHWKKRVYRLHIQVSVDTLSVWSCVLK